MINDQNSDASISAEINEQRKLRSVCVYCGSRTGGDAAYTAAAVDLGKFLAKEDMQLVYGAGSVGLMGVCARSAIQHNGRVVGIIPAHLDDVEITQDGLSETIITNNMHDRKKIMFDRSDAFVVLPGGFGTMDEMFEMLTWAQLGLHDRPIIVLDINGFWTPLFDLINNIVQHGFAESETAEKLTRVTSVAEACALLKSLSPSENTAQSDLF